MQRSGIEETCASKASPFRDCALLHRGYAAGGGIKSQIIFASNVIVAFCVSVVGRSALVAMDRRVRSGGSHTARTENADGLIELATALRESRALPAPSVKGLRT